MKNSKRKIFNRIIVMCLIMLSSIMCTWKVNAATFDEMWESDVTIINGSSVVNDDNNYLYYFGYVDELKKTETVHVVSSNPEVVRVFEGDNCDYLTEVTLKGKENDWQAEFGICSWHPGTATVTVEILKNGTVAETRKINVTVVETEPVFPESLSNNNNMMAGIANEQTELELDRISETGKITLSCSGDAKLIVLTCNEKHPGSTWKNIWRTLTADDTVYYSPYDRYYFEATKPGTCVLTVKVEQDGKTYTKSYTINVEKNVNAFKSIKFGSTEMKKVFNKNAFSVIKKKKYKKVVYGKTLSLKLQKGYKLISVRYSKDGFMIGEALNNTNFSKAVKMKKSGGSYKSKTKISNKADAIWIAYKDSKGYRHDRVIYY